MRVVRPVFQSPGAGRLLFVAALMFVLAWAGIELSRHSGRIAAVWFANGAVLAVLFRHPRGHWTALLASAAIGNVAANLLSGDGIGTALGLSLCNVVEVAVVAALVGRTSLSKAFAHPSTILRFVWATLLASAVSAIGAMLVLVPDGGNLVPLLQRWFIADALGLIIVTPLALAWVQADPLRYDRRELGEILFFVALSLVGTYVIMAGPAPLLFPLAPILMFAGFRLRPVPASAVGMASAAVAIALTIKGLGPIATAPVGEEGRTLLVQAYLAMTFLLTLPISAASQEREQLVSDLADSEERHRLLAENSADMIARIGVDGSIRSVSAASTRILGYSSSEVDGFAADWTIHPADVGKVRTIFARACRGRKGQIARYRQRRSDGSYIWLEATYNAIDRDGHREIVASIRDIDRRRHAELIAADVAAKLRESNRLLTLAEEMAEAGHWRFDFKTGSFDCSHLAMRVADTIHQVSDVRAAVARIYPADRQAVLRAIVVARRSHRIGSCRARIVGDDGSVRWTKVAIQSVRDERDKPVSLFGIVRDIEEKVRNEQRLIRACEEAQSAAEAKSAFLATMSHEIRTPMTGVLGMIELLRDTDDEGERRHYLDTLKQSADLLMAVLNDVLDYSRIEHGMPDLRPTDFDMERLCQSTLDLFFNAASSKGLLISLAVDPGTSPFVHGDPIRLQQVMSNLINNAIKFTDRGQITIRVASTPIGDGLMRWRFEVRDSGIGIAEQQIETLFEPFTQAEHHNLRRFGGTGLGLSISRRLVRAMGGEIGVESALGKGSTFWFEIPLTAGKAEVAQTVPPGATMPRGPARHGLEVLVAEDNPVNQLLVSALLKRMGHVPTCVANGREALEASMGKAYDCILMDMQMPEMDGISATRAIRGSGGASATVPIFALTADASSERRRFYDQAGLNGFMAKPIDLDTLRDCLAGVATDADWQVLDADHLARLRAALGPTRFEGLLSLFASELGERPAELEELHHAADLDSLAIAAHSLKGAAMSIGANRLADAAKALEDLASRGDREAAAAALPTVVEAIAAARLAVESLPPQRRRADA